MSAAAAQPAPGFIAFIGDAIHARAPHEPGAIYFCTLAFCALAMIYVYARCRMKGAHTCLAPRWQLNTLVHAAPMPVYMLMPLAPLDSDLMSRLSEDRLVMAFAGIYALYVSIGEVNRGAKEACKVHAAKGLGDTDGQPKVSTI